MSSPRTILWVSALVLAGCGPASLARPPEPLQVQPAQLDSSLEARKHYSFAKQYEQSGMYEDAVVQYQKALGFDARNPKTHYSLGRLLHQLGCYPAAKAEFLRATRLDSTHADAYSMLGRVYGEALQVEAQYDSCLIAFERAADLKPDDADLQRTLVELYAYRAQYRDALRHSARLTQLAPQDPGAWTERGELAASADRIQEAADAYAAAWALDSAPETLRRLAALQYEAARYEDALRSYRTLSASAPQDYDLLTRIADLERRTGDASQAVETRKRMVALRPDDLASISWLAEWYLDRGQLPAAREWVERGLQHRSGDGRLLVLSGDCYVASGREDLALTQYEQALGDSLWKANAQQKIWAIRPPLSEEEKKRRTFFGRGREPEADPGP